jgi:hypothetical protein
VAVHAERGLDQIHDPEVPYGKNVGGSCGRGFKLPQAVVVDLGSIDVKYQRHANLL